MIIHLGWYVERYMNDYIVYNPQHFSGSKYRDVDRATNLFDLKYKNARAKLEDQALLSLIQAVLDSIDLAGNKLPPALDLTEALTSGDLLERTMDEIAEGLNEGIEDYYRNANLDFQQIMTTGKQFNSMLKKGHASVKDMDDFFRALLTAISTVSKVNPALIEELSKIGKTFTGKSRYSFNTKAEKEGYVSRNSNTGRVIPLSPEDKILLNKIVTALKEAEAKFSTDRYKNDKGKYIDKTKNTLSHQSFSSTINHIFSTVIGEELSRLMINNGIRTAVQLADTLMKNEFLKRIKEGTLVFNDDVFGKLAGTQKDEDKRVSKVDILHNGMFSMLVRLNGQTYEVELGVNTSVKWYKGGINQASSIHMVAETPLRLYLDGSGSQERYLAHNTIVHRWDGSYGSPLHLAYRRLRSSVAATFFNDWISGTGKQITGTNSINKVQLLMVNGKVYSVMRIIRNICNELLGLDSATESAKMPFVMKVPNLVKNEWKGEPGVKSLVKAEERSKLVNKVLEKIVISCSLNGSILSLYAY